MTCSKEKFGCNLEPIKLYSCRGYHIAEIINCASCQKNEFILSDKEKENSKNAVDCFINFSNTNHLDCLYASQGKKLPKIDEIAAQHIVTIIKPDHRVVCMDIGSGNNNQYDLLLMKEDTFIANETTQAIYEDAKKTFSSIEENKKLFKIKVELKYSWTICVNANIKIKKNINEIAKLLKCIEDHKNNLDRKIGFSCLDIRFDAEQQQLIKKLFATGVVYFTAKNNNKMNKCVEIIGPFISGNSDIWSTPIIELFRAVQTECCKVDNITKLKHANVNERWLFISINAYMSDAAEALTNITNGELTPTPISQDIIEQVGGDCFIHDSIDVVWLATLANFTANDRMGFRLAKIFKNESGWVLQGVTQGVVPYLIGIPAETSQSIG